MEKSEVYSRNENAILNSNTFEKIKGEKYTDAMTIPGAVNKTAMVSRMVFFAPLLLTWLVPVDCIGEGCSGRMRATSERSSF